MNATTTTTPEKKQGRRPDYKGDGSALWINEKDGKKRVAVRTPGHTTMTAFEVPADKRKTGQSGARSPDFRADGISVWFETSPAKQGRDYAVQYAKVVIVGHEPVSLFLNQDQ